MSCPQATVSSPRCPVVADTARNNLLEAPRIDFPPMEGAPALGFGPVAFGNSVKRAPTKKPAEAGFFL